MFLFDKHSRQVPKGNVPEENKDNNPINGSDDNLFQTALQWDSRWFKIFSQISTLIKTYIVGFRVSLVCHYSNEQDYITIRNYTGVVGSKK